MRSDPADQASRMSLRETMSPPATLQSASPASRGVDGRSHSAIRASRPEQVEAVPPLCRKRPSLRNTTVAFVPERLSLFVRVTTLRLLAPPWSAVFLAASMLFCAAILLQPLTTAGLGSPSFGPNRGADPKTPLTKLPESVVTIGKAVASLRLRADAPVVRASAPVR
jgi:hypothetical protein